MKRKNKTDYAILGLLHESPLTGYEIKMEINQKISHFWNESIGNIYPRLKYLNQNQYINMKLVRQDGKPNKKIYSLTRKGKEYFKNWFKEKVVPSAPRNELLLKLFFGKHAPDHIMIDQLKTYLKECQDLINFYRAVKTNMNRPDQTNNKSLPYWLLTLESGIYSLEAAIKWQKKVIKTLESL